MSRNNAQEIQKKMTPQRQRFGIRKLSVGVASVLLGTTFLVGGATVAHADSDVNSTDKSVEVTTNNQLAVTQSTEAQNDSSTAEQAVATSQAGTTAAPSSQSQEPAVSQTANKNNLTAAQSNTLPTTAASSAPVSESSQQVQVTYKTDDGKTWEASLDLADGQTVQAAVQAEIDKDNAIQDKMDENTGVYVNQSPLLLQYSADQDAATDVDGTGALKDQYEAWLAKKAKEFPLAGYTLGEIQQDNDNYIVNLIDPGYSKMIALNDWETFKRQIEFKKYYGDGDTATFKQEDKIGYAVDSTGKWGARSNLSIVYPGLDGNPQNNAVTPVSIDQVNSKTSTIPGAPKSDVNKIAWRYVTPRKYNPVTGQIDDMNSQGTFSNNAFPIQFDGEKVDTAVEDGAWTTTEGDVAKTGTAFGEVGTYGITTRLGFVNGQKATHNPPTVYITYYHNQPVVVTFEDITDGEDKAINLSNFNAPELTWQSSNNDFVTRQESDNDVDTLQLKTTDTYQGTDVKYSYQAGDYTKQGALTTDSHATKANNAINGLTTLNYQDVLNAYLANGYAFVSADDDDLSYDKDKVWTKDSSTTENDGHKLNVLHRVIKLVRTATMQTATQTVTRNINFVADREGTPTLADPIKQTVTYTSSEFYSDIDGNPVAVKGEAKDANGNVMKDANGNILYIVDGTKTAAPITWTAKDGAKFNAVLSPTDSTNQITGQDTIEVTDGDLKGDWIKFDTASESLVPAPTTINGEWNGYTQNSQDKTQYTAPDVTLVYYQEAHENSNSKTVNRVVHFKTVDGQTLLKDIPVESVTFVQNYYTDGNGNVVSVKTVKNSNGQDVTVVKDVLTGQDAENAKAWKVSDGSTDFAQVDVPEITDGLLPGDWVRVSAERNSENGPEVDGETVPADEIQDTVENGANQEYTIYYAQQAFEHTANKSAKRIIHYVADKPEFPVLQDEKTQTINFTTTYYTTNEDGSGDLVAVKKAGLDKDGNIIYVVDYTKEAPKDKTWTVNTNASNQDVTITDGQASYNKQAQDIIFKSAGALAGTWTIEYASDDAPTDPHLDVNYAPQEAIPSTIPDGSVENVYLVYTKDVNADITYWDITDGEDKAIKLGETDPDAQEHGKPGEDISFTNDPAERIKEYEKQGYVFVSTDFNNNQYGEEDSHFNVYLVHGAIQKHETKESVRKIHYVADEGKGLSVSKMPELQDVTTQDITIDGSYYVDKVTGKNVVAKEITDANGNKVWVVAKYVDAPAVEWKTVEAKSVTGENGKYTFEAVTTPDTITLDAQEAGKRGVNDGTWTHDSSLDLNNGERNVEVSNWDPNLTDGYLVYKQVSEQPSQPTQPSEPSQPTSPTSPTEPTEPSQPTSPTSPTEPTEPSQPTTPTSPTEPTEPSQPTSPTSPTEPSEPSQPTSPTSPTEPSQPTSPTEPTEPSQPTSPTSPTEPSQPTSPTEPTEPSQPTTPAQPTDKTYHWTIEYVDEDGNKLIPDVKNPNNYKSGESFNGQTSGYNKSTITVNGKTYELVPAESSNTNGKFTDHDELTIYVYKLKEDTPVTPDQPTTPDKQVTPDQNTNSNQSVTPEKPVEPATPVQPTQPGTPVETVTPSKQVTPVATPKQEVATPAQPAKSGKLPQTGNTDNQAASFGALGLLGTFLTGLGLGKKRRRN